MPGQSNPLTEDLTTLMNEVRLEVGSISDAIIEHHAHRTIIDFCERTQIWQEDVGPIQVIPEIDNYEISSNRFAAVVQVRSVFAEDDNGDLVEFDYGQNLDSWSYYRDSAYHMTVAPLDELVGRQLIVNASLKPKLYNGVFKFAQIVTDDYFDAIASGIKSRILRIPNKEWTNPQMAGAYAGQYEQAINAATVRVGREFNRIPHRVAPKRRSFF